MVADAALIGGAESQRWILCCAGGLGFLRKQREPVLVAPDHGMRMVFGKFQFAGFIPNPRLSEQGATEEIGVITMCLYLVTAWMCKCWGRGALLNFHIVPANS
ncbi:hypothetical protein AWH04_18235 [Rhodococcus erythropolis]|nr:hypothetical protein AWH04_18235 [Rhodococcus erythropolis]